MSTVRRFQHKLYYFTSVEIAADKFGVGFMFFKRHDGEVVGFHDRVAYCCDALEKVLRVLLGGAGEGFDEDYLGGWLRARSVEALDADGHGGTGASW